MRYYSSPVQVIVSHLITPTDRVFFAIGIDRLMEYARWLAATRVVDCAPGILRIRKLPVLSPPLS